MIGLYGIQQRPHSESLEDITQALNSSVNNIYSFCERPISFSASLGFCGCLGRQATLLNHCAESQSRKTPGRPGRVFLAKVIKLPHV